MTPGEQRADTWDGIDRRRKSGSAPVGDCDAGRQSWDLLMGNGREPGIAEVVRGIDTYVRGMGGKLDAALQPRKTPWWLLLLVLCAVAATMSFVFMASTTVAAQ